MRITAEMCLTRNSRKINRWESSGWCFGCFRKTARSTWQSVKASILGIVIRGRHITSRSWRPLVREILTLEREEDNNHDKFAVSLLKDAAVLGHDPREILQVFWYFLRHEETIICEDTDQRKLGKATSQR